MALEVFYSLQRSGVTNLLFSFLVSLVIAKILFKWYQERNYPPGPFGIPVFGYIPFLGKKPNEKLRELSRKYGDVFSLRIGPDLHVCVSDFHLAKELLTNPALLFRNEHAADFLTGNGGFAGKNGEEWRDQRRFTFYTMRNLGLGKGLWETLIQEAIVDFTEDLKSHKGKPVNLEKVLGFFQASNNISLLLGRHLDKEKDAEKLRIIYESTKEFMKFFGQISVNSTLPWLRKFMEVFRVGGHDRFYELLRDFEGIFKTEVERRIKDADSLTKDDYIGCFYREMQKRKSESDNHTFTMDNLLGNLIILFISSNDSTMASISWLLLLMCAHPDVQEKVHDEIHSLAGRDGVVNFDDKAKLPYTMATIFEMLRIVSVAPLIPPRLVTEDITVRDYFVPKGSAILVNMWSILRDPRYFNDPEEFKPERFLTEDNKATKNLEGFFPFSVGKRNCPGEGIAIMTIFLYFVALMQKFKVSMPPGKKVNLEPVFGGAHLPNPQEICFLEC